MKTLHVFNRQKTRPLNTPVLRQISRFVADDLLGWPEYEIAIHLVSPEKMAALHLEFLNIPGSTDVITFDYTEQPDCWRGEIFISVADAVAQAKQFRSTWESEVTRYVIHGLLHIEGFDDTRPDLRRVMKRRENKLLKDLSRLFVLSRLKRGKHV
jgi:rRNA maturation RNase YbeY